MNHLDQTTFQIKCPDCGEILNFSSNDGRNELICHHCQCHIMFDKDDFLSGLQEANRLVGNLLKEIGS